MILPLGGFGGLGFSPGIAPLSLSSPSLSTDAFGSLSLGASDFAMSNSAMSLIAQGYGTGAGRTYSPFGVSGMYGSIGLGAPMLGGLNFAGPGPNFLNMNELFMQLWNATFGPKPSTPGGSSRASATQPAADDTGNVGGARKTGEADEADEDKADGATGAGQAKGDAAKSDWKTTVGNAFKGTGARVADTADTEGKRVVRLEPDTNDPKTSRPKLARALRTLHRNGVQTARIGDESVPVGKTVRAAAKAKTELREATKAVQDAVTAAEAKPEDNDLKTKARSAVDRYNKAKRGVGSTWIPNTRDVLRALQRGAPKAPVATLPTADAGAAAGGGDVGAALAGSLKKVNAAKYAPPLDKKLHSIVVKVGRGRAATVAAQVKHALDFAGRSMGSQAAKDQQIQVTFLGEKVAAEAAQKQFDAKYKGKPSPNLPVIISVAEVKRT